MLESHAVALVAISHPRLPDAIRPTTDFLYVRFHGLVLCQSQKLGLPGPIYAHFLAKMAVVNPKNKL